MKLKNYWKRFWTLDRHHAAGFTLVELIVVIAILAILAGIGIPVYSGYIKKANMQADMTLASEVAHALQLHYYSDPTNSASGYVVLSTTGASSDPDGVGAAAMQKIFGDNWREIAALKYDGWERGADATVAAKYNDSTFKGKEKPLLDQIGSLTGQLSELLGKYPTLVGNKFDSYLSKNNLGTASNIEKSNAAVLYAAERFSQADEEMITTAFNNFYASAGTDMAGLIDTLSKDVEDGGCGLGYFGACAAMYAQAEAFSQHMNAKDPTILKEFHEFEIGAEDDGSVDGFSVAEQVGVALQNVVSKAMSSENIDAASAYVLGNGAEIPKAATDTKAFLAAMGAIKENEAYLMDRVGETNCYTDGTVESLLNSYLTAAEVGIQDGEIFIHIDPSASGKLVNILPSRIEYELAG